MSKVGILLTIATFAVSSSVWIKVRATHVRDVDAIEVNNLPIRLQGVDGPELNERGGKLQLQVHLAAPAQPMS